MERTKASFLNRARAQYAAFAEQRYTTIAGTLVFFLVTSLVPLLFFLTLLVGSAGISAEEIFGLELFDWAKDFLVYLTQHAEKASAGANVLFIATTLWSATGFFYHLKRSGEIIYGAPFRRGIRVRVGATVCALVVLFFGKWWQLLADGDKRVKELDDAVEALLQLRADVLRQLDGAPEPEQPRAWLRHM